MKNSIFVLILLTVLVVSLTLVYRSIAPFLPEGARVVLQKDAGVYSSQDSGNTWVQDILQVSGGDSLSRSTVYSFAFHPGDARILYAGTSEGLFMRNGDEGTWQDIILGKPVYDIDINPKDRQTIFITTQNSAGQGEIERSVGAVFSFSQVFTTTNQNERIVEVVVDFFDPTIILALTDKGAFLRSDNGGDSWRVEHNFAAQSASALIMDQNDSRILYVVTNRGLFYSQDKGKTWTDRTSGLSRFPGGATIHGLVVANSDSSLLYAATDYGILRSENSGRTFAAVEFLFPLGTEPITAITIFPQDARRIWASVGPQIYQSLDAGVNWQVRTLPTNHVIQEITTHPFSADTIFVGLRN